MGDYLLYQAYGNQDVVNEALLSILSHLRQPGSPATVLIYTDSEAYFRSVLGPEPAVAYVPIAAAQWRAWRGAIDFVHRVKIEVLRHAAARFTGRLLYVDTDTIITRPLAEVFAALGRGERFMHVAEGRLGDDNPLNRKLNRALSTPAGQGALVGRRVGPATRLYNAGALGLRLPADAPLLDEVLALTDRLYAFYPKHVMEQLAFGIVWAAAGPVREAAPWICHYWDLKELRPVLAELFAPGATPEPLSRSLDGWQARAARLDVPALVASKARYQALPAWRRAWQRWRGQAWQLPAGLLN